MKRFTVITFNTFSISHIFKKENECMQEVVDPGGAFKVTVLKFTVCPSTESHVLLHLVQLGV
jgi:hypothetical protein